MDKTVEVDGTLRNFPKASESVSRHEIARPTETDPLEFTACSKCNKRHSKELTPELVVFDTEKAVAIEVPQPWNDMKQSVHTI